MKIPIFIILLFLAPWYVSAQWESIHGPFGSYITDLGQNDHYVFAATTAGLYRSEDVGQNWEIQPFFENARYPCLQFDVRDSLLIADAVEIRPDTTIRHMYKSIDNGESWIEISRPPVQNWVDIGIVGASIFAFDHLDIWISENDGQTWFQSLINNEVLHPARYNHNEDHVFVGHNNYLYIYSGDDTNWEKIQIPFSQFIGSTYAFDSVLLVRDYDEKKLFVSEDFGQTWFDSPGAQWDVFENYFAKIGNTIYATGFDSIYTSSDNGHHWESKQSQGLDWVNSMISVDSVLISGYDYVGMSRSLDMGSNFHYASEGMDAAYVQKLFMYDDQLLSAGYLQGVFNYDLSLGKWHREFYDENARLLCHDMVEFNGSLYLTALGYIFKFNTLTDSWERVGPQPGFGVLFTDFYLSPYGLLVSGYQDGYYAPLHVLNHIQYWPPFTVNVEGEDFNAIFYTQSDQYQFLAGTNRLARVKNGGAHWEFISIAIDNIRKIKVIGDALFLIQSDNYHSQLHVSYDNGETWQLADDGIPKEGNYTGITNVIEVGDLLLGFTLGYKSGIYFTSKDHLDWQSFNEGLPYLGIKDVILEGEYLYAATGGQGVWKRKVEELFLTSTEESNPDDGGIQVYPNPASDQFNIQLPGDESIVGRLTMYDMQGRLVMEKQNADLEIAVKVANIPDGLYWIELQTTLGIYSGKLVIQH